jgi:N-acetyl-anhydromuramyl-L-alanine amidase AmpD
MLTMIDVREELRAKYKNPLRPTIPQRDLSEIKGMVIHCTDDPDSGNANDVYATAKYHTSSPNHISPRGAPSICYHYYVERDKENNLVCYQCLNDTDIGWHAGDTVYKTHQWNNMFLGIVVDHKAADQIPEDKEKALVEISARKCLQYGLSPDRGVIFHRDVLGSGCYYTDSQGRIALLGKKVYRKDCPGWSLDWELFVADVRTEAWRIVQEEGLGKFFKEGATAETFFSSDIREQIKTFQRLNGLPLSGLLDDSTTSRLNDKFNLKIKF